MNNTKFNMTDGQLDKIIRVAYGDATRAEKNEINTLAENDPSVKELLEQYINTARSVHEIKIDECPPAILESVLAKSTSRVVGNKSILFDLYSLIFSKPIASALAVTVIVAAIVTSMFINRTDMYDGYSLEEIERANSETRMALALVGKIFTITETSITDEILTDRVGKPINQGIKSVNKLFNEGEKK